MIRAFEWLPLATFRLGLVDNYSVLRTLKNDLKIQLVSFKKVKKHVVKQYNSKRPLYRRKVWLIKRRKQGLKSLKFRTQNDFPTCY